MIRVPPFYAGEVTDYKKRDWSTEAGARELADRIMSAWRAVGHDNVVAWAERISRTDDGTNWTVRTNLVAGLPPSKTVYKKAS